MVILYAVVYLYCVYMHNSNPALHPLVLTPLTLAELLELDFAPNIQIHLQFIPIHACALAKPALILSQCQKHQRLQVIK